MSKPAPIVVKRVIKKGDGHHGGSWKVAFADFATAMMAFFLLLWIMNTTTPERRGNQRVLQQPKPSLRPEHRSIPQPPLGEGGEFLTLINLEAPASAKASEPKDSSPFEDRMTSQEEVAQGLDRERLESLLESLRGHGTSQALRPLKISFCWTSLPGPSHPNY